MAGSAPRGLSSTGSGFEDGSMTRPGSCQSPARASPRAWTEAAGEPHGPCLPNRLCHGLCRHQAERRRTPGISRALGRAVPDQLTGQIHARPLCRRGCFSRPRRRRGRTDPGPGPTHWSCRQPRPLHSCGPSVPAALPSLCPHQPRPPHPCGPSIPVPVGSLTFPLQGEAERGAVGEGGVP